MGPFIFSVTLSTVQSVSPGPGPAPPSAHRAVLELSQLLPPAPWVSGTCPSHGRWAVGRCSSALFGDSVALLTLPAITFAALRVVCLPQ